MSRRWESAEVAGRGTRLCLVIDPEDGTHPIRTYGYSKDEILEKVAKTAEAGQAKINSLRAESSAPRATTQPPSATPPPPSRPAVSADEQMQATADLNNPAKAPEAIKTLLRAQGFDVDKLKLKDEISRVANLAQEWERQHPEYPTDPRNERQMMDRSLFLVSGDWSRITTAVFDTAFQYLRTYNMLFEADVEESTEETDNPTQDATNGNSDTRIERPRGATSYRRSALGGATPVARPTKPKYTRAEIEAMNSRQLRDKIEQEPGFKEWFDVEFSRSATA